MPWRGLATRKPSVHIVIGHLIAFLVGVRYFNNCVIINAHEPGAKMVSGFNLAHLPCNGCKQLCMPGVIFLEHFNCNHLFFYALLVW